MKKDSTKAISAAIAILNNGGVIAHATDTCYGFACDVFSEQGLGRLYKIKKMPNSKPVSILVSDLKMAKKYGIFNKRAEKLAKKYWPGALTIVVKRKKSLPRFLNPKLKTVGIRLPAHALSRKLARLLGRPITTTSANISGKPAPYSVVVIRRQLSSQKFKPDFIIDSGGLPKKLPSTIVEITGNKIKILRVGATTLD